MKTILSWNAGAITIAATHSWTTFRDRLRGTVLMRLRSREELAQLADLLQELRTTKVDHAVSAACGGHTVSRPAEYPGSLSIDGTAFRTDPSQLFDVESWLRHLLQRGGSVTYDGFSALGLSWYGSKLLLSCGDTQRGICLTLSEARALATELLLFAGEAAHAPGNTERAITTDGGVALILRLARHSCWAQLCFEAPGCQTVEVTLSPSSLVLLSGQITCRIEELHPTTHQGGSR